MTYPEAIEFLYSLRWFGTKFGLDNTLKLARLAGNPQLSLRFIHVAGTNGKGSTCAMLERIYREAGLRAGLFTSPHLVAFGERIQVNRQCISESEIVRHIQEIQPLLAHFAKDEHPTFFEVVTVMALRYFAEKKCDLVIWETGLGGRLDATNIVTPLASLITNIQYDHQKWLGESLESIASEKAGIIKPGVPVITAANEPAALKVISDTARRLAAHFTLVSKNPKEALPDDMHVSLLGEHQRANAALAVAAVKVLNSTIPVSEKMIRDGLADVRWPGRLQLITRQNGQKVLLDGAHNIAGAESLAASLSIHFPDADPTLILGILGDKDYAVICQKLARLARRILIVPVQSERSASIADLARACREANPPAQVTEHGNLQEALSAANRLPFIIVTGSLYLVGEALEILSEKSKGDERSLNEWGGKPFSLKT